MPCPHCGCEAAPDPAHEEPGIFYVWTPKGSWPTVMHPTREVAEAEAGRLAFKHPGAPFLVLKAVVEIGTEAPKLYRNDLLADASVSSLGEATNG